MSLYFVNKFLSVRVSCLVDMCFLVWREKIYLTFEGAECIWALWLVRLWLLSFLSIIKPDYSFPGDINRVSTAIINDAMGLDFHAQELYRCFLIYQINSWSLLSFVWQYLRHMEGLSLWQVEQERVTIPSCRRYLFFYLRDDGSFSDV